MTEGLEVSVVKRSALERTNRLDSEFHLRKFTISLAHVRALAPDVLTSTSDVSDGNHFTISDAYTEVGVPYFRGQDVSGTFFADPLRAIAITQEAFERPYMRRSHLKSGDVLLSIVGTIGASSLVDFDSAATCSCKLAILRPKNIRPGYLATYIATHFGQNRIGQLTRGAVQKGFILEDADQFEIPRFPSLEPLVERNIGAARNLLNLSRTALDQAESHLLDSIGLNGWTPTEQLAYSSSTQLVRSADRLDSQYFQPAKLEMLARLSAMPGSLLQDLFDNVRDLVDPKANPNDQCRNYDLTDALQPVLDDSKEPGTFADMDSQKARMHDGDLVVSRLRSYLREIAVVRAKDEIPSVGSSEFYVLRHKAGAKELSAEALMIYLRAPPVQTILKWCQDGSQHPRFSQRDLMLIPIPDRVPELNEALTAQVRNALARRAESLRLLAAAKRAVEIAIEKTEAQGLYFLEHGEPNVGASHLR